MSRNSLMCGAAALLAVQGVATTTWAADLVPLKAPAQFVRLCPLYGVGFLYIPGTTDACIKVGGYVRLQGASGASGDGIVAGASTMVGQGQFDRLNTNDVNYQARAALSVDTRISTEMGILRGYFRMGPETTTPLSNPTSPNLFWDRGYIQFAGFTAGRARSFFDIFSATDNYLTYGNPRTTGDTDLNGAILLGYTYQIGNGYSASLSVEDPGGHNKVGVINAAQSALGLGVITTDNGLSLQGSNRNGLQVPDIIANARFDQGWGYVGISGAVHQVAGAYYGAINQVANGHPTDKFGWAVGFGGQLNVGTEGDTFGVNFVASEGAVGFATKGERWEILNGAGTIGLGWAVDGVFDNSALFPNSSIELTQAWSINGAYQHVWHPKVRTSVYGGFVMIDYNQNATNIINSHLPGASGTIVCGVPVAGAVFPPLGIPAGGGGNSCNPDFSFWQIGTRTQYNPVAWLDLGIDFSYTRLNTAYKGPAAAGGVSPGAPHTPVFNIDDQNVLTLLARAQINFLPGR